MSKKLDLTEDEFNLVLNGLAHTIAREPLESRARAKAILLQQKLIREVRNEA